MTPPVRVEGLSKRFCRNLKGSLWYGVRDIARELLALNGEAPGLREDEFWALDDVSFEIPPGECLGLVGRNGAGKSTLLRLVSGIIRPDRGRIAVRGRVGALIDLSAGLNPILTGRENIYVNAALVGLPKPQTDRLFDDIVGFAELEEFIHTPVQNYSSGMRARLGFSVAAHFEPDVMLVDEVLAVGDFEFRLRCLRRLNDMKQRGTSFVLVSHNLNNILQFADRALWLERGKVMEVGATDAVCAAYLQSSRERSAREGLFGPVVENDERVEDAEIGVETSAGLAHSADVAHGEDVTLRFDFRINAALAAPHVAFPIYSRDGAMVTSVASAPLGVRFENGGKRIAGRVRFGPVNLNPGSYVVMGCLQDGPEHVIRRPVAELEIDNGGRLTWGTISFDQQWSVDDPLA